MHIKSTNISMSSADNKGQLRTASLTNNNSSKSSTGALWLLCGDMWVIIVWDHVSSDTQDISDITTGTAEKSILIQMRVHMTIANTIMGNSRYETIGGYCQPLKSVMRNQCNASRRTLPRLVPNYAAWWQAHMCANNSHESSLRPFKSQVQRPNQYTTNNKPQHW